ncbi:hypothetical protein BJF78_03740 [Pseudonocardia sp. CNS-139]|nr:hypothetical protein BJF78_03740 [Pseudonocardia sp. CNS-139]
MGPTGTAVVAAFQPAWNATTDDEYRCRNGQGYGVGVLSRLPSAAVAGRGIHPVQDPDDPERRAWLCLGGAAIVCTTHLAHVRRDVALAQCRHLMGTVVPGLRAGDVPAPLVLGADLNLGAGDTADLRSCLPAGIGSVGDGGLQHVVATPELAAGAVRRIDLGGATDHPGLLVVLAPAGNDRAQQARVTHR